MMIVSRGDLTSDNGLVMMTVSFKMTVSLTVSTCFLPGRPSWQLVKM
ncbi:MAG: hypothetical protein ACI3ZM_02135 [Candidatus Cryptobacteroides sp.]